MRRQKPSSWCCLLNGSNCWIFSWPQSSWLLAQQCQVSNGFRKSYERWIWYDVQMMWYRAVSDPHDSWDMTVRVDLPYSFRFCLDLNPRNLKATAVVLPSAALGSATCELPSWANSRFRFMSLVWEAQIRSNSKDRRDCHWLPIRPWLRHPMTWWLFPITNYLTSMFSDGFRLELNKLIVSSVFPNLLYLLDETSHIKFSEAFGRCSGTQENPMIVGSLGSHATKSRCL